MISVTGAAQMENRKHGTLWNLKCKRTSRRCITMNVDGLDSLSQVWL